MSSLGSFARKIFAARLRIDSLRPLRYFGYR
jgi:hypothetical protein